MEKEQKLGMWAWWGSGQESLSKEEPFRGNEASVPPKSNYSREAVAA